MFSLLHVIPDLDPRSGGTVSALEGLAVAQTRQGWKVHVLCCADDDTDRSVIERLTDHDVSVTALESPRRFLPGSEFVEQIHSLVHGKNFVHVHAVWEELQHVACRACQRLQVPYVVSPHGMLDPWSLNQGRVKKQLYLALRLKKHLNRTTAIHCTTETEQRLLRKLSLRSPTVVIPNGIDLSEFELDGSNGGGDAEQDLSCRGDAEWFVRRYPQLAGKRVVLFLSRLHHKKGLDLLLPAFAAMKAPDVMLVLAGPGEETYVGELRNEVERLGLTERVLFTGMLKGAERISAMRAAEVFVLPSYQENFGIAVIESLAAGTPVIISDQVNLAEVIKDSGVGQVIKNDVDELTQAMERWLVDDGLRTSVSAQAIAFAARFDFESVAELWRQKLNAET